MINLTRDFSDDIENTQRLPVLTAEVQLDEAMERERAARIQIVELMRQNLQQAQEIERLQGCRVTPATESNAAIEERLFEVCGALKDTLSMVLHECRMQSLPLKCTNTATRLLDASCDKLEQILSAPGFHAATALAEPALRSMPVAPGKRIKRTVEGRSPPVPHLELLISESNPAALEAPVTASASSPRTRRHSDSWAASDSRFPY